MPLTSPRALRLAKRRPDLLADLPEDLLVRLFESLGATNLCFVCMTCKRFRQLEAQHQELLWFALAVKRWDSIHLRWPSPTGQPPLRWASHVQQARCALDFASWKHRFAYLRAHKSSTTRSDMMSWITESCEFGITICSPTRSSRGNGFTYPGKGWSSWTQGEFFGRRFLGHQCLWHSPLGDTATHFELHVRCRALDHMPSHTSCPCVTLSWRVRIAMQVRRTDGRVARLFDVPMPTAEQLDGAGLVVTWTANVLPQWADEPVQVDVRMHRDGTRRTRTRPHGFRWEICQLTWGGSPEGWWEKYNALADLFVALHSGALFRPGLDMESCELREFEVVE